MREEKIARADKWSTFWASSIYSVIMIISLLIYGKIPMSFKFLGISAYIDANNISNYLSVFSIHITTVFLTTGLMSTLGAKEELIYHVDIVKRILLEPVGRSFKALSVYSFLTLFWATAGLVFKASYMVIFSAVIGVIIVTCLFFKMISIYFEREKEKEKIKKILKEKESIDGLLHSLTKLHLIMRSNIQEKDIKSLVDNMTLLIELYQYFLCTEEPIDLQSDMDMEMNGEERPEHKSECVLDFLLATERTIEETEDVSIFEIYVKIYSKLWDEQKPTKTKKTNKYKKYFKKQLLEEMIAQKTLVYTAEKVVKYGVYKQRNVVYGIYKMDNIAKYLLGFYKEDFEKLNPTTDYEVQDIFLGVSKYIDLAERMFKARMVITPGNISFGTPITEYFHQEIKMLVNKDEQRIRDGEEVCSKEFYDVCEYEDEDGVWISRYASALLYIENTRGCFVRALPRLALKYAGADINNVLNNFYYAYKTTSFSNRKGAADIYYAPESFRPRDEKTYETMLCLFFQGCAELLMTGEGLDIIDKVAELLFDFWKSAQYYKESESLQKFYKDSFACIGCRLLYIDDNSSKEKYYKNPEDVQKFLSRLKELCKQAEMEVAEDVYREFLNVLEQYGPDYYSEEALEMFKKIIKN